MPPLYLFATAPFAIPVLRTVQSFCRVHGVQAVVAVGIQNAPARKRYRAGIRQLAWIWCETDFAMRRVVDVNSADFIRSIPEGAHGIVRYYGQIFRRPAIERFATLVNIHNSILPWYRGPQPDYWLAARGERMAGFSLHQVTQKIDAGPILYQRAWPLIGQASPWRFARECDARVHSALLRWLRHIYLGEEFEVTRVDGPVYHSPSGYLPRPDFASS